MTSTVPAIEGAMARRIQRPRLTALLDAKPWARLAVVSAPAGFGKTTAVASWLATATVHGATVAIVERDNDPVRFVRAVMRALAEPGAGTAAEPPGVEDGAAEAILEALRVARDASGRRVALVLDDYHLVTERRIHEVVGEVVQRLPEGAMVVIATRADPPIPVARLRARDELIELRADDLRFSPPEAEALLRAAGIELDPEAITRLAERTEGWAAVLRLAAVALRRHDAPAEAVRQFGASHRFVLDYVVEEVLAGLPAASVDFLLETSILERLCGDLCDAVTGRADGQAVLEQLERDNLLLLPLDEERRWFRYHALFAEVLRGRLRTRPGEDVRELDARASRWLEAHGLADEAIAHALAAGDRERAAALIADASLVRLNDGELATVRRWLDELGAEVVRGDAQLSLSRGWCDSLTGRLDEAEGSLADAEAAHACGRDGGPASTPLIPAELALLRSFIAGLRGDSDTAARAAAAALDRLPFGLPPVVEATLRGDARVFRARALLVGGRTDEGFATYLDALPDLRAGGNMLALGRALNDLVEVCLRRGEPGAGMRLCDAELVVTPAVGGSAYTWAAIAKARESLGDPPAARDAAARALELARRAGETRIATWAAEAIARLEPQPAYAGPPGRRGAGLVEPLTGRELEVLRLVAEGRSNRGIAETLFVTVGTVKSHVHAISGKLGAANRVEAVARARRLGLLD